MTDKSILSQLCLKDNKWLWPAYDEATYGRQVEDRKLFGVLEPYLKGKSLMVQAGGNCGFAIERFVLEFDTVYTFEPDPLNFQCLCTNLPYSNVVKIQACLGDAHGMVSLNRGQNSRGQKEVGAVHVGQQTGTTPVLKIDDFNFPFCDLIQLDVEGYEYNALLGGIETIKKHNPLLCLEWFARWSDRYHHTLDEVETLLGSLGYTFQSSYLSDRIYAHA
jgi:FkbM family methyltransferase